MHYFLFSGASNLNNLEWHDSSLTKGTVNDDEELERLVIEEPDEKWDCESILS